MRTPVVGLVRSKPSIEEQLKPQPSLELVLDERSRSILSKTFLQRSPESLNDRDGAGASDSTETMLYPKATKDGGETVRSKLRTLVRNEMLRGTEPLSRVSNKSRYSHRVGLRMEDFERERHSRKHVEDHIADQLQEWQHYYNWNRPHGDLRGRSPMDRFFELMEKTPLAQDVERQYVPAEERIQEQNYAVEMQIRKLKRSV